MTDLVQLGFSANTSGLTKAQTELDKTTAAGGRLDKQSALTSKALGLVGAAIASVGFAVSAQQIIKYTDSWANLNTQLRQVTDSESELLSTREKLLAISRETRIDLDATVGLYAELTRGTGDLNISSSKLMGITETLNNLFLAGGKPLSEMTGAIRQLNQGFASGVLRGDEFNSVAEGAPRIMDALTASLNMTRGELRAFAATGGITSEVMVKALESYSSTAKELADTVEMTFEQAFGVAQTNITQFIGESAALGEFVSGLSGGVLTLSENLEPATYALGAAAGVISASLLPATYAYTAALGSNIKSQLLVNTVATKTVNVYGSVTVSAASATVATNALGMATKFLLGPWGLLITALGVGYTAFTTVKSGIDEANLSAETHAEKMSELERVYSKWSQSRLEETRNDLLERSNEILFERLAIEAKIEEARSKAFTRGGVNTEAYAELNKLKQALSDLDDESEGIDDNLQKVIDALDTLTTSASKAAEPPKEIASAFDDIVKSLDLQMAALQMGADEYEIYAAKMAAIDAGVTDPNELTLIEQKIREIQNMRKAIAAADAELDGMMGSGIFSMGGEDSGLTDMSGDLDDLISQVNDFGGAWSQTGSTIANAIGGAVDVLGDYSKQMQGISELQSQLTEKRKDYADGTEEAIKIDESLAKLQGESANAQISALGKTIGLSAQLFAENSKERKALHALEMGFMAAEIALAAEKAIVSAVGAVANQGSGDPYSAFGRIAAMIGIMAGVLGAGGIAFGASGGSYTAPQEGGTGTTLGDSSAQSASISNSLENFEDIQIEQLAELKDISAAMTGLAGGIENLAASFARNLDFTDSGYSGSLGTVKSSADSPLMDALGLAHHSLGGGWLYEAIGDPIAEAIIGGFSKTKKSLVDSGIDFLTQSFGEIIGNGELSANMYQVIETEKKKFWGLSSSSSTSTELTALESSIAEQMGSVFGFIGDSVISAVETLGLEASHIIHTGIGAIDLNEALAGFRVDIENVSFLDKTGEEIQEELEAIFSQQADLMAQYLVPSIAEYQKINEGLFETLQRLAYEQAVFNDSLDRTGMSLNTLSSALQIDVAQSIIGLIGSVEEFSSLSNEFFSSFYSDAEQLDYLKSSLTDVFDSLGLSLSTSKEGFRDLVESIDLTTADGQQLYATLMQITPAMAEYLDALDDLANDKQQLVISSTEKMADLFGQRADNLQAEIELLEAQGKSEEAAALTKQMNHYITVEAERAEAALAMARQLQLDATDESLHSLLEMIFSMEDAAAAELERANAIAEAQAEIAEAERKAEEERAAAQALADKRKDLNIQLLEAQGESERALALSREIELAGLDESLHALMKQIWAQEDLNAARLEEAQALEDARALLEDNVAFAENELEKARQAEIDRINLTVDAAENAYNKTLESINAQRDAYEDLIKTLTSNVDEAANALNVSRQSEIDKINLTIEAAELAYNKTVESINAQRDAYNTLIAQLESGFAAAETNLNSALNAELSRYDDLISAAQNASDTEIELINSASSARISALNTERGIVASIASQYGSKANSYSASEALSAARSGDFTKASNIESGSGYTDSIGAALGAAREAYAMSEIGKLADAQLSDIDRTIAAAESSADRQILAIEKASSEEVEKLEAQSLEVENQVKELMGIDDSILSLDLAMAQYQAAQSALNTELASNTLEQLQSQEDVAISAYEAAQASAEDQINALNAQVDSILGVDNTVKELSVAISDYQNAQSELDKALNNGTLEQLKAQEDTALAAYESAQASAEQQITALNSQIDELLNIDNSVMSVQAAIELLAAERQALSELDYDVQKEQLTQLEEISGKVVDLGEKYISPIFDKVDKPWPIMNPIYDLSAEVKKSNDNAKMAQESANIANKAIAKNTASTAKILQRLELDGIETRSLN